MQGYTDPRPFAYPSLVGCPSRLTSGDPTDYRVPGLSNIRGRSGREVNYADMNVYTRNCNRTRDLAFRDKTTTIVGQEALVGREANATLLVPIQRKV